MRQLLHASIPATLLLAMLLPPATAQAEHPFEQGRIRLSLALGSANAFDQRYYAAGGGFAVFVVDGLEVGIEGAGWFGGQPAIGQLSPQVRYIAYMIPNVHPYAGAFYRHWFIGDGEIDYDTAGGRLGVVFPTARGLIIGIGGAYETQLNRCNVDCAWLYPELWISVSF